MVLIPEKTEDAVFGGGCFWCTEAVFGELRGVRSVMPGYAGGIVPNPTYEQVSSEETGHAEVIKIEFDPNEIAYHDLLTVFFATHDPTTPNRQGPDAGTQYRSVIFTTAEGQKREADEFIKKLSALDPRGKPIVTEVKPLDAFYPAGDEHREYFKKNPSQPYCQVVIEPKVQKLQKEFADLLKTHNR